MRLEQAINSTAAAPFIEKTTTGSVTSSLIGLASSMGIVKKAGSATPSVTSGKETLTSSIEFVSVQRRSREGRATIYSTTDHIRNSYKLIDLGTAVGVNDEEKIEHNQNMKTLTDMAFAG